MKKYKLRDKYKSYISYEYWTVTEEELQKLRESNDPSDKCIVASFEQEKDLDRLVHDKDPKVRSYVAFTGKDKETVNSFV